MYTVYGSEGEPSITLGPSFDHLSYTVTPHPEEFTKLARAVGLPKEEIANLKISLTPEGFYAWGKLAAGRETKERITLAVRGRSRRAQKRFLELAAHELDHRVVRITRKMDAAKVKRGRIRAALTPWNLQSLNLRYYFNQGEAHAQETAREILKSPTSYNLLTFADKPGSRRLWSFKQK